LLIAAGVILLLTAAPAFAAFPGDNGRLLANRFDSATGTGDLVTMEADGSDVQAVPTPGLEPFGAKWSPDGQRIAFRDGPSNSLWTVAPDGTDLTMVASDATHPAWSPDGTRIAFGTDTTGEIVAQRLSNGSRQTLLTFPYTMDDGSVVSGAPQGLAWSPDGGRIVLSAHVTGASDVELFTLDVTTGVLTRLTQSPLFPDAYPGGNRWPDWSPDGDTVVFQCNVLKYMGDICRIGGGGGAAEIFTETLPLTPGPGGITAPPGFERPVVSPDGSKIVNYLLDTDFTTKIQVRNADGSSPETIVPPSPSVTYSEPDWQALPATGPPDADGDGVVDAIDAGAGAWSDPISGQPATVGSIVTLGGLSVLVEDAADPEGVRIRVSGAGPGPARVSVCGFATIALPAGSDVTVTCGSVTVRVSAGPATIELGGGASVSVPAGASARVNQLADGRFSVQSLSGGALGVSVDGISGTIPSGATRAVAPWDFQGFDSPVDNLPTLNQVKAGQAIPLKWTLQAPAGPVTSLAGATLTTTAVPCSASAPVDPVEETLPDGSGLRNQGGGRYLLNWKTPSSYAGSCRRLHLDIGDGVTHDALFRLTR
jgi:Tol biopolymer transport system component